jgi:predicted house-cleaning noncanonical NTP pyrophosphatase (MazG superfamily)
MKIYNKLVRDKIPAIIKESGATPKTKILSGKEYFHALKRKLYEEMNEFNDSYDVEELVDILEVVYALSDFLNVDHGDLYKIRSKKLHERGGFYDKILLVSVEE